MATISLHCRSMPRAGRKSRTRPRRRTSATPTPSSGDTSHDYHPWSTLAPRYWTPTVGSDGGEIVAGAAVGGADALGRHAYLADVEWASSRARPDWGVSYVYDRWRAALFASASDDTDPFRAGEVRSIELNAGVLFPWKRVRWAQSALAGFHAATDTIVCATCERPIDERAERRSIRTGYAFNSAKRYGYSVSLEEGWSLTATQRADRSGARQRWKCRFGDRRPARLPPRRHASQRAGGAVRGRALVGRRRGTTRVHRRRQRPAGRRLPLRRRRDRPGSRLRRRHPWRARRCGQSRLSIPNRAHRAWRRARSQGSFAPCTAPSSPTPAMRGTRRSGCGDARVSLGVELSVDTVLGYSLPVTFTSGAAWRHDGVTDRNSGAIFGRIGRAF